MESQIADVVQGYATLTSKLLGRWSSLASKAASRAATGTFDAAGATEDMAAGVSLVAQSGALWAAETLDALAALADCGAGPNVVTSQPFHAPAGATLEPNGPLVKGPMLEQLPIAILRIRPAQLGPTQTEFTLHANASGHRGATYVGSVKASVGTKTIYVPVWITVP